MNKNVNIIYYVDTEDNTKTALCAIPTNKDMRDVAIRLQISNEIVNAFGRNTEIAFNSTQLAQEISHYKYAKCQEYEFGVEEVPIFE